MKHTVYLTTASRMSYGFKDNYSKGILTTNSWTCMIKFTPWHAFAGTQVGRGTALSHLKAQW